MAQAWAERAEDADEEEEHMKVVGHDTWAVRIAYEEHRAATHIVLQLNTDEGAQGVSYLTPLVPWTVAPIRAAIDALMENVHGADPMAVESINAALLARAVRPQFDGLARSAVSLIDIALWDLKAKALSQPLFRLLGGSTNRVPTHAAWNLFLRSPVDLKMLAKTGREHVARGFRAMKFHVAAVATKAEAVAVTSVLREAVGNNVELYVDMNWSRTVDSAIALGRDLAPFDLSWIEDPIPPNDYDGLRQISEALETQICAGETFHQALEFRSLLERRSVEVVMIDLEVGGITQWLKMAHLVETYRLPVTNHVTTEVSAHVIAAVNGLTVSYLPWAEPLFKEGLPVQDGRLVLFERPGLGLELDPTALKKFAL
jgi:L-alanine-DL-glutamate epimerase-like enolase superfamily enzyme